MAIDTAGSLIDILRQGQLLETAQLAEVEQLPATLPDPRALARDLVRRGWLTPFQVNQIFQGRSQELVLGTYLLLERLGNGPGGTTYRARHSATGRVVTLKTLAGAITAAEAVDRFREQIQEASLFTHPHLAATLQAEQVGDTHFFTAEYVEGTDLARLVQKRGPLPAEEAAEYVCQAALALEPIHQHRWGHGAVKPANLVLTAAGSEIKLVGRNPGPDATEANISADLHALGSTLCFLINGKELAPGEPLAAEVPAGLNAVIQKLLAPPLAPAPERYHTPQEVADALAPFTRQKTPRPEPDAQPPAKVGSAAEIALPAAPPAAKVISAADISLPGVAPVSPSAAGGTEEISAPSGTAAIDTTLTAVPLVRVAAKTSRLPPWLRERVGDRRWQAAVGGALALAMLLLAFWVFSPRGDPGDQSGKDNDRSAEGGKEKRPLLHLARVAVLGGEAGRHWGAVRCGAWSPKKDLVATGGEDNAIRLWDATTLEPKGVRVITGHTAPVNCLAFSTDGSLLISGSDDKTMRLWDVQTGKDVGQFAGHTYSVRSLAFSPNGKQVLSGSYDNEIRLWNVETRESVEGSRWGSGAYWVTSVAFDHDGKHFLSGSTDGKARLWKVGNNKELCIFEGHKDTVTSVAFSPDEKTVLTASADKTIRLWDLKGKVLDTIDGHTAGVNGAAFVSAGRGILSAGSDGTIRRWEIETGETPSHREAALFTGHKRAVLSALPSLDGKRVLSVSADFTVRLWNIATGKEIRPRQGHTQGVNCVALSSDGRYVLSGGADNTVLVWDVTKEEQVRNLTKDRTYSGNGVLLAAFSPGVNKALAVFSDTKARVWEVKTGGFLGTFSNWNTGKDAVNLIFAPSGGQVIVADQTSTMQTVLREVLVNGEVIRSLGSPFKRVTCVAVSTDGKRALSGSEDWKLREAEVATGKELSRLAGHTGTVLAVSFTKDGSQAVSVADDRTVWLWDLDKHEDRQLPDLDDRDTYTPRAAAVAPDCKTLAYCGPDDRLVLWSVGDGKKLQEEPLGGPVRRLVFSADGKYLATANGNGTVSVYRVKGG